MAIVKMKRLRLVVVSDQKDALLRDLLLLGSVELSEQSDLLTDERFSGLLRRDVNDSASLRADKALLAEGIKLLDRYAPEKKPLLSAKPEITQEQFLSGEGEENAMAACREIVELDADIRSAFQEKTLCRNLSEELTPWRALEIPLEYTGTEHVAMRLGTLPMAADFDALCASLEQDIGAVSVQQISSDEHTRFLCVFFLRKQEEETLKLLHQYGFAVPNFGGLTGLARDNLDHEREQIEFFDALIERKREQIARHADKHDALKLCYDRVSVREIEAEAREKLVKTDSVVCLSGWSAVPQEERLLEVLGKYDCAWELIEPTEEEYDSVPVQLKNNVITNGMNMVTNMYSLPRYGSVDPNPLMAPFFILFYGIMMADMGYGLLMILGALVVLKKLRPKEGTLSFTQLLLYCGITTFIFGALTGGFFADAPLQVARLINPDTTWQGLPALFNPLEDSMVVLLGALVLGVIQLNTGLAVSFVKKLKHGDVWDALLYEGALWVILVGGLLFAASALLHIQALYTPGLVVLLIGLVLLLAGALRGKKGFALFTSVFSTLYNEVTGWFGDILSYSRIMALMLAGSVIGMVFNNIGAMFGNIFLFIPIFLIGHALNMGLNILGCYVHDLRLQCLEYFGKFYEDGGRPFAPFKIRTKYVDVTK